MSYYCKHDHNKFQIVKTIIGNGSIQVRKKCPACQQLFEGPLPHANYDIDDLPFYEIDRDPIKCEVRGCNNTDVELNHYFPRALACRAGEDADAWPTGYLCRFHHQMWHRHTTPGLIPERKVLRVRN